MCDFGGNLHKLCSEECNYCFNRSFASHLKAVFWHKKYNNLTPREVTISSNKKGWFICSVEDCGHTFESVIGDVTRSDGKAKWCPYCSNPPQKLCFSIECDSCFERSFASHPKSKFWHSTKNKLTPREVAISCNKKFWFICSAGDCGHEFESVIYNITNLKTPRWCPYCSNQTRKLCSSEECNHCFNRSFASHPKSKFWHVKRNKLTPREITIRSAQKGWFICDKKECGYEFESVIYSITNLKDPRWCPYCKNKTENLLYQWLMDNGFSPKRQVRFDWCRNPETRRQLPFDFLVGNVIIELDGPQHFKQVSNWQSPELTQMSDTHKERIALHRDYSIVRLLQQEVLTTLQSQIILFEDDVPQFDQWQTILLDLLSAPPSPTLTLISGDALWPGLEGHHIIEVTYETRLNFISKRLDS